MKKAMTVNDLIDKIKNYIEWMETTEGDEVECISIENLQAILSKFLGADINLHEDD
jgi:hypothetical protein